ncbi:MULTISPECIES: hypothetical protein [Clostridium]|uniref:hypothetical protein n=1 Tax=Clostridium TaxID=1485 RepID=UPI0005EB087E|nr:MULTISPECIES: hypothetical protein [Clostridium]AXB84807.1 hypothetical protein DRB99_07440 [Clostridium butyricum]MDU1116445.1 hypothetical protein [Clostridium sp.]MDU7711270.1 hypothetical protein [Clostridium butyricum]
MAKKRTITVKKYIGTANKFLKYGGKFINKDEKFEIAEKDVAELKQYAEIEEQEVEVPAEDNSGEADGTDNNTGEDNGAGKEGE